MRVIFDQGTPVPIRPYLVGHSVRTTAQQGWETLSNGDLLTVAKEAGFEVLLTTDKNLRYQQNLASRKSQSWYSAASNGRNLRFTSSASKKRFRPRHPAAMPRLKFLLSERSSCAPAGGNIVGTGEINRP